MAFSVPIFMKNLSPQLHYVKISYTEFNASPYMNTQIPSRILSTPLTNHNQQYADVNETHSYINFF
jgi:hypothetical protein